MQPTLTFEMRPTAVDPLQHAERELRFWKLCSAALLLALIVTAFVRHPAATALLICVLALLSLVAGGALLAAHRGDEEMGIAPREGKETSR